MEYNIKDHVCHKYKVVLVGDSDVGKSNLHSRFLKKHFYASYIPTIGVDYGVTTVDLGDHSVKLNVWDTAGQERFHALTNRLYMKGARGVVFVYDITRLESFQHIRKWLKLVEQCESIDAGLEYMLIGNKSDLTESRAVTTDAARALADQKSMLFMETSALNGDNTSAAFRLLAAEIHRKEMLRASRSFDIIHSHNEEKNNNKKNGYIPNGTINLNKDLNMNTKCC